MGTITGIQIAKKAPTISHLFFADDTFIFLKVDADSITTLKDLFNQYQLISGQKINFKKSTIYFSHNTPSALQEFYGTILGVKNIGFQDKYLGIPSRVPRSRKAMFRDLEDKLRKKLAGWRNACLSPAGKEILIKSVGSAFPSYVMNCFYLPSSLCRKFNNIIGRFWWSNNDGLNPIHWVNWSNLTKSKCLGGLGFREFRALNLALLAKQGWWLATCPNSLAAKVLKGKYYPNSSFLKAHSKIQGSWIWQSILPGRSLLLSGLRWQLGNGQSFNFLEDNWLQDNGPSTPVLKNNTPRPIPNLNFFYSNGQWIKQRLDQYFCAQSVNFILQVPIPLLPIKDNLVRCFTKSRKFSVKTAYHRATDLALTIPRRNSCFLGPNITDKNFWKTIWSLAVPPKIKFFL
ncbi:Uncharacterized mitochondrial protein AtMg00310 [Linum grandiflorum]